MDPFTSLKRALALYAGAVACAFVGMIPGHSFSDPMFRSLLPPIHYLLGVFLLTPISHVFHDRWTAALFGTSLVSVALFILIVRIFRLKILAGERRFAARVFSAYGFFALLLFMSEFMIAGARTAPLFLLFSIVPVGLFLHAGIESARAFDAGMSSVRPVIIRHTAAAAAVAIAAGAFDGHAPYMAMTLGMLLFSAALSHPGAKRRGAWGPAASPAGVAFQCCVCGMAAVGWFWLSAPRCDRPPSQNSRIIEPASYGSRREIKRPYDMVIPENTRHLFTVYKEGAVEMYDLKSRRELRELRMRDIGRRRGSTQRVIADPATRRLFATYWRADNDGAVAVFDAERLRFQSVLTEPLCPAISLELDPATHSLIALCEAGSKLVWYDTRTLKKTYVLPLPRFSQPGAARLDARRRRIYVSSGSIARYLYEINADTKRITRRANVGFVTLDMALDADRRRAYLARPLPGRIDVVNLDTMRIIGSIQAGAGVRDLDIDPNRRILVAGDYIDGIARIIDLNSGLTLRRYSVGKQVRGVYHSAELNRTFAASACGVFELK